MKDSTVDSFEYLVDKASKLQKASQDIEVRQLRIICDDLSGLDSALTGVRDKAYLLHKNQFQKERFKTALKDIVDSIDTLKKAHKELKLNLNV